jgi:hypothetical protein
MLGDRLRFHQLIAGGIGQSGRLARSDSDKRVTGRLDP